jgi:hypothetical protein
MTIKDDENNIDAESVCRNKEARPQDHLKHLLKIGWKLSSSPVKALIAKYPELRNIKLNG